MAGSASGQVPEISAREAHDRLAQTAAEDELTPALIDVREVLEFRAGHAAGAVNIPLSQFRQRVEEVPRDRDVLFICHVGERSMMAARFARQQGVVRVFNVDGGTDAWEAAGLPMEK
ncbi:MAG TPA: rhodanese-like domain-containing protein [Ktedonobacterales bacterium]